LSSLVFTNTRTHIHTWFFCFYCLEYFYFSSLSSSLFLQILFLIPFLSYFKIFFLIPFGILSELFFLLHLLFHFLISTLIHISSISFHISSISFHISFISLLFSFISLLFSSISLYIPSSPSSLISFHHPLLSHLLRVISG